MRRVTFLVDGFNVYHSLVDAGKDLDGIQTKWLDLRSLCKSYLHLVGGGAQIEDIFYFTAKQEFLRREDPCVLQRHETYIQCLTATGVKARFGHFRKRKITCPHGGKVVYRQEKKSDVALAVTLIGLFHEDRCDTAIIMSGDTDYEPAYELARDLFFKQDKQVLFAIPYKRHNNDLLNLAPGSFFISRDQYVANQFPDPFITPDGDRFTKPVKW